VGSLIGGEDGRTFLVWHGFDVDEVAVVIVEDEHVGVATGGRVEEASSLVGEDLAGDVGEVDIEVISSDGCWGG